MPMTLGRSTSITSSRVSIVESSRCPISRGRARAAIRIRAQTSPAFDPSGGDVVLLFNPRKHDWAKHFAWSGAKAVGLTAVGRATVITLRMNAPIVLAKRRQLMAEGVFEA
jgi:hypothetical protein